MKDEKALVHFTQTRKDNLESTTSSALSSERPKPTKLPFYVKPLVWLYGLFSKDKLAQKDWLNRIDAIEQADAIDKAHIDEKAILADPKSWQRLKSSSFLATAGTMTLGIWWVSWLIPVYAIYHGFGWLVASAYLLPIPIAWRLGRRLWMQAGLEGMRELGPKPDMQQRLNTLSKSMLRGMVAGGSMAFTLVFLQGLISWFMTPADTIVQELLLDFFHGSIAAAIGASMGAILAPLASRAAPGDELELEGKQNKLLPEPDVE